MKIVVSDAAPPACRVGLGRSAESRPANRSVQRRRTFFGNGFTLVELLVVIAIIGLLIALLLPAVQSARESSRRTQCSNNLKQLMLAFLDFEASKKGFPPCRTTTTNQEHGWMVNLLPYFDEGNIAGIYNLNLNFFDQNNQAAVNQPLPVAWCPSTPIQNRQIPLGAAGGPLYTSSSGATLYGYAGDYLVNHLLNATSANAAGLPCAPNCTQAGLHTVLFVQNNEENTIHPLRKITDGLSQTALIQEQAGRSNYYIFGTQQASNSGLTDVNWWGAWASYQHYTYQGYNGTSTNAGSQCAINCNNGQGTYSFHPAGANLSFCDGSVRFIADAIPVGVLMELLTRDGAETVPEGDAIGEN
ncbi:MAG TPA: DUF1559 domain-containing protein [Pirellulales bacterium]|nr:DUF1559 domain-containing protein [Pirellulales bacterium]